jgi:hypothetical protein
MHFTDPKELGGLPVIDRNDVTLGVLEGVHAEIRSGYPRRAAPPAGHAGAAGRTMLHRYAGSPAKQMS